ncbi:MAG: ScpA family protein [Pseudomonadales bacterium]
MAESASIIAASSPFPGEKVSETAINNLPEQPDSESGEPVQQEIPFAVVNGETITEIPPDLYIPPEALAIILETFEGPLDLLLYLIKRQNLDILELDVLEITSQYMKYVEMMDAMKFELAAEYLVMAAMLAQIKSRLLLPRVTNEEGEEEDPRAELVRRLQEYERFKEAAENIDQLPREGRDFVVVGAEAPEYEIDRPQPNVEMKELMLAMAEVLRRAEMYEHHRVVLEPLSTREKMTLLLERVGDQQFVSFASVFVIEEGRLGVVVTFLAMMELLKEKLIDIVQSEAFGPIHISAKAA